MPPPRRMRTRPGRASAATRWTARPGARTTSAACSTRCPTARLRGATPTVRRPAALPAAGAAARWSTASAPCAWTTGSRRSPSRTSWRRPSGSRWWCPSETAARTWRSSESGSKRRGRLVAGFREPRGTSRRGRSLGPARRNMVLHVRKGVEHYWKVFVVEQFDEQLFNRAGARELAKHKTGVLAFRKA